MTELKVAPNPKEIDELSKDYLELKDKFLTAQLAAADIQQQMVLKGELLKKMCEDFGSQWKEKSKLLHGLKFEVMRTAAQTPTIDAVAVDQFRDALRKSKQARLMNKMFEKSIRWTLRSEASVVVRGQKLSTKLQALWAKCIVLKDKTPSLTVRPKEKAA